MRVTAVLNLKGGVAKTTTVINMAAILADRGNSVLVVDADSQCNTTEFLAGHLTGGGMVHLDTLADGLRGHTMQAYESNVAGVSIIPADDSLMDLDLSSISGKGLDLRCLTRFVTAEGYDYCLIDCPPAFNAATAAALLAADDVVIPIKLDAFSLRGMSNLTHQIANMRKLNPSLQIAGLLPTMCYRSETLRSSLDLLRLSEFCVFPVIRRTAKVDEMTFAQAPIIVSSPKSAAAVDYKRFVSAYLKEEVRR